jgi:hypothetical protein
MHPLPLPEPLDSSPGVERIKKKVRAYIRKKWRQRTWQVWLWGCRKSLIQGSLTSPNRFVLHGQVCDGLVDYMEIVLMHNIYWDPEFYHPRIVRITGPKGNCPCMLALERYSFFWSIFKWFKFHCLLFFVPQSYYLQQICF